MDPTTLIPAPLPPGANHRALRARRHREQVGQFGSFVEHLQSAHIICSDTSLPAHAPPSAAVATPRRTTPQRATKTNAAHARTSNRFFREKLQGQVRPEYYRVVQYEANPHFDEEAAKTTCGPEDIGQCVAKLLKDTGHWNVWRHEDGTFVTFNTSSSSFRSIYDIDSLEESTDKFSSYEALGKWARGESGFFQEKILHSSDRMGMVQRFVEQMGLSEAEESGGP